ncbi:hypothetical protein LCGC14_1902420 [marine sediment metagenome]|uniref:Uncharacterized protein n=1 Tax=marine sediment metagenome TaxID=412755 RepID=A0A0F9FWG1_9ZZZZ|nr:hypothetical protein [Desulfobacterales bacterium]
MKRLLIAVLILLVPLLSFALPPAEAAGVWQSHQVYGDEVQTITFQCIGSAQGEVVNTDILDQYTRMLTGWYLYKVEAFPTSGGVAPDAANVFIYDADGLDLLGSEDGGTTAYAGLNLVHATLKRAAFPNLYLPRAGNHVNYYPEVRGTLTLDVDGQGTNAAEWTIVLTFVQPDD